MGGSVSGLKLAGGWGWNFFYLVIFFFLFLSFLKMNLALGASGCSCAGQNLLFRKLYFKERLGLARSLARMPRCRSPIVVDYTQKMCRGQGGDLSTMLEMTNLC